MKACKPGITVSAKGSLSLHFNFIYKAECAFFFEGLFKGGMLLKALFPILW
jgi:hypothetical protein